MMSAGVTRAGAFEQAIRKRVDSEGWRMDTWPKASITPWAARMRLAAARSAKTVSEIGPPDAGCLLFIVCLLKIGRRWQWA